MTDCHLCGREVSRYAPPMCTCGEALHRAEDILRRLSAWDMMDTAADGRLWREQIADVLTMMRE